MLKVLLSLIFARPFISSLAFPYLNSAYSAVLLGFITVWLAAKRISFKKIKHLKYPLMLFALALAISVAFSPHKIISLKELYKYITGVFLFFVAASLTGEDKMRLIRTIVLTGLIICLLAIYQYFFGFRHILDYMAKAKIADPFALEYVTRKRAYFPFVTPNVLGGYLATVMPLVLMLKKNRTWLILTLFSSLLLTKSLGALLSLLLGLVIYFYLTSPAKQETALKDKPKKWIMLILLGLLVITSLVFIARSANQKQHLQPVFSTFMRLNYWRDTLKIITRRPLTGVGLGNFNLIFARYAHNSYLQLWAEMGILGITSFLWLIIAVFKSALKKPGELLNKNWIACLTTACIIFLIHNITDFSFFLPEASFIWWLLLGLLQGST